MKRTVLPFLLWVILNLAGLGACAGSVGPLKPSAPLSGYQLVWQDEFEGSLLDATRWSIRTGARRDAVNSAESVAVANGLLTLTTYTDGTTHRTGFVDTAGKYQPLHGFMEARIRFHSTPGEWGAFWIQSPTMGDPVGDVGTAGAEIDVVEHRAVDGNDADVSAKFSSTIHWDGYGTDHKSVTSGVIPLPGNAVIMDQWHTFGVEWSSTGYTFYVDGIQTWSTTSGVSRRDEYLMLTCEVEDAGWAGDIPGQGYGSLSSSITKMDVDWVRVWQKP